MDNVDYNTLAVDNAIDAGMDQNILGAVGTWLNPANEGGIFNGDGILGGLLDGDGRPFHRNPDKAEGFGNNDGFLGGLFDGDGRPFKKNPANRPAHDGGCSCGEKKPANHGGCSCGGKKPAKQVCKRVCQPVKCVKKPKCLKITPQQKQCLRSLLASIS